MNFSACLDYLFNLILLLFFYFLWKYHLYNGKVIISIQLEEFLHIAHICVTLTQIKTWSITRPLEALLCPPHRTYPTHPWLTTVLTLTAK